MARARAVARASRTTKEPLKLRRPESVAAGDRSALEPGIEPALTLLGGAVGEGIRHRIALRLLLQGIVADRRRRAQRRLDVTRLQQVPFLLRMVRPYAREAVGLQLDLDL